MTELLSSFTSWIHGQLSSPAVWILLFHGLAAAAALSLISNTMLSLATTWRYSVALFLQLVGVSYALAFWSMHRQVVGLVGEAGILPLSEHLNDRKKTLSWRKARGGKVLRAELEFGREMLGGSNFLKLPPEKQKGFLRKVAGPRVSDEELDFLLQPVSLGDILTQVARQQITLLRFFENVQFSFVTSTIRYEVRSWAILGTSDKNLLDVCAMGACALEHVGEEWLRE